MTARNTARREKHRQAIAKSKPACGICGEAIDYTLGWQTAEDGRLVPHPRMFVVDHKVPLHRGGTDTLDNKQAAHWSCNSTKRARIIAPIVKRSGSLG